MVDEKYLPVVGGNPNYVCPGNVGGNNGAFTYAYSDQTKPMYVPVIESCAKMEMSETVFVAGQPFWGGGPGSTQAEDGTAYGISAANGVSGVDRTGRAGDIAASRARWRERHSR